ncbi:MAG: cytochrome c [Ectothiorhodospiraceae bacterium]|jgi:mono/diheme cytochrome c family protein|nr:cytochrome c [Ectothiorhodospiraceae bacterium]
MRRLPVGIVLALGLAACGEPQPSAPRGGAEYRHPETGRWYDRAQVEAGAVLFTRHCAQCHGDRAQGDPGWRYRGADGKFPPPPLDGSAHAWHHPLDDLRSMIRDGSPPELGNMPAWGAVLTAAEIDAAIAWFQSLWQDEIYVTWVEIDRNRRH